MKLLSDERKHINSFDIMHIINIEMNIRQINEELMNMFENETVRDIVEFVAFKLKENNIEASSLFKN